ncbi:MAG: ABC transporter permease [Pirellulales bacterium]
MSLWKIAWRNIQQRALASTLTAVSMALGVALVVAVLVIHGVIDDSFRRSAAGYDLIVGAKGSGLELVLNTVFHLRKPIGNIPYTYYKEFTADASHKGRFAPLVKLAIPFCVGDSYGDYRVVGTLPEMFDRFEYAPGKHYQFAEGRNFKTSAYFEGVIGSLVARKTGLAVGDTFEPTHGVAMEAGQGHTHAAFTVVGVLAPTGTPNDRAMFVNMEGFYLLRGHAKEGAGVGGQGSEKESLAGHGAEAHDEHDAHPIPDDQKEVTAILVQTDPAKPIAAMSLPKLISQDSVAQAVLPAREIYSLFDGIVGNLKRLVLALAVLIVVVAGIGIMVSIYNSMSDRRREIAIMRALGAGRETVMAVVLLESIMLSLGGGLIGIVLGHGLIGVLNPIISAQTGVSLSGLQFVPYELVLILGLVVLASVVGFLPAMAAYRTDVARSLSGS